MPRLTRAESQARTRDLLVETARELFLSDGYQATSVAKVADRAGLSTGAVYSNFEGKSGLALAVLHEFHTEQMRLLQEIFAQSGGMDAKLDAFENWSDQAMETGWPQLELEFALEAKGDPALVSAIAARERSAVDTVASVIEQQLQSLGLASVVPVKPLAAALVSQVIGVAVQRIIDPKVSIKGFVELARVTLHQFEQQ